MSDRKEISWRVRPYVERLDRGVAFSQANYGDGEWSCILGIQGQNSQEETYWPALRQALIATLQEPRLTYYGINPGERLRPEVRAWIAEHFITVTWVEKSMLSGANCQGELGPFIAAIRRRRVVLVGPAHLRGLDLFLPDAFVEVPLPDAFFAVDDTVLAVKQAVGIQPTLVCFCSGMATNVTMSELVPLLSQRVTMLDCGAIFDPYVGVNSRSAYRKPKFQDTMKINCAEADKWT